jgi:ribosomal protein S21
MSTNVEVTKNPNENNASLIRRFTRRVQGSGILPRVRGNRYHEREMSKYKKKAGALKRIAKHIEVERLKKLGKEVTAKKLRR